MHYGTHPTVQTGNTQVLPVLLWYIQLPLAPTNVGYDEY